MVELTPEEFALHSGRIGGSLRLAETGPLSWVVDAEERCASHALAYYGIRKVKCRGSTGGGRVAGVKDRVAG